MRRLTLFLLCSALLATACSLKSPAPEWSGYLLAATRPQAAASGSAGALHVGTVRVAPAFAGGQLMVRASEFGYEPDFYHRFLSSPGEMLHSEIVGWLMRAGYIDAAFAPTDDASPAAALEIYVSEFYADARDRKRPAAVLKMEAQVKDSIGKTIFRRPYSEQIAVTGATAEAMVAGLNAALVEVLTKLEADLKAAGVGRRN